MTMQKDTRKVPRYLIRLFVGVWLLMPALALSDPFNSGSTGADGAFSAGTDTVLTVPPGGVFHFTTVTIPTGVTVTFTPNATNTPVTILASGDVTIDGTISVDGKNGTSIGTGFGVLMGGAGGPGGFAGGAGGLAPGWNEGVLLLPGQGLGPGSHVGTSGCAAGFGTGGTCSSPIYGTSRLLPLIGGSGGGGGPASTSTSCVSLCNGGGGGGGGGALLIASSGTITVGGNITSKGGEGGTGFQPGGPGSGGGIRLVANTITGNGTISTPGGSIHGYIGGTGRVRLEANALNFSGTAAAVVAVSAPGLVNLSPIPTLSITAIGGIPVPSSPAGSFAAPDVTLPSSTNPNFVTINLAASNIPVGTIIKVTRIARNGTQVIYNSNPLTGTAGSSTTTADISVSATLVSIIRAETSFPIQTASNDFPTFVEGEKVERVRVAAAFGGPSEVFLVTESGKEVRLR